MLFTALSLLKEELNNFILQQDAAATTEQVVLGNIALFEGEHAAELKDKLVISVVNLQEEETLRNNPPIKRQQGNTIKVFNPPLYLNIYVLIAANWPEEYEDALKRLNQVLSFFQHRRRFSLQNSPFFSRGADLDDTNLSQLSLSVDLQAMTFEQLNHLWGSLGGKQMPAALYRIRCSEVKYDQPQRGGGVIQEIQAKL